MTDSEIIKALEYCSGPVQNICRDCPFYEQCENDETLAKYALNLIKRQKAEIMANSVMDGLGKVIGFEETAHPTEKGGGE